MSIEYFCYFKQHKVDKPMTVNNEGKHSGSALNFWLKPLFPLFDLLYPNQCLICENELSTGDQFLCLFCEERLPKTYFENFVEPSALDQLFWGRVKVERTYAPFYFQKESTTQKVLHELKYGYKYRLGNLMGKLIVQHSNSTFFQGIDALLPVPVHFKKEFTRGYNQSEAIAKGISENTSIPIDLRFLEKRTNTGSQTKRGKWMRWENVKETFQINKKVLHTYSHVLLVDDVITTGATLESLIKEIQSNYPELRISVVSFALAK
jgi:competence protein ComFC